MDENTAIVASKRNNFMSSNKFIEHTIQIDRVTRVVKGGRRFRFRALVVVGDPKTNQVGIGTAKGGDVTAAVKKATNVAQKKLIKVPVINGTIPHQVNAKVSGAKILIMPAGKGTGLITGGVIRSVLETAGISNVLSKSRGSSNKINLALATIKALNGLTTPDQWTTNLKPTKTQINKVETV